MSSSRLCFSLDWESRRRRIVPLKVPNHSASSAKQPMVRLWFPSHLCWMHVAQIDFNYLSVTYRNSAVALLCAMNHLYFDLILSSIKNARLNFIVSSIESKLYWILLSIKKELSKVTVTQVMYVINFHLFIAPLINLVVCEMMWRNLFKFSTQLSEITAYTRYSSVWSPIKIWRTKVWKTIWFSFLKWVLFSNSDSSSLNIIFQSFHKFLNSLISFVVAYNRWHHLNGATGLQFEWFSFLWLFTGYNFDHCVSFRNWRNFTSRQTTLMDQQRKPPGGERRLKTTRNWIKRANASRR